MINPYFCYALAFGIALLLYPLGWSKIYPPISVQVLLFLLITMVIHGVSAFFFARSKATTFREIPSATKRAPIFMTAFIYCLWIAEFLYAGGVPLLNILLGRPFDYKTFGIPSLHVFVVTFSSFYTIFLFHQYLSHRSRRLLVLYAINLVAAILIYNRGMLLFNLFASVSLFMICRGRLRHVFILIPLAVLIAFLFGVLGNMRVSNESRVPYTSTLFLKTGQASDDFNRSIIPDEFFWAYIYSTSPIANLEVNVRSAQSRVLALPTFWYWLNDEVLFDFISKRVNAMTGRERPRIATIEGPFNAPTVYSGSYAHLGFTGIVLMALIIWILPWLYLRIIHPSSAFFLTGLVTLNVIFFFMVFDNTLRFTGLSFQMVYPVLLHFGCKWLPRLEKIFL